MEMNLKQVEKNAAYCRARGLRIPTFAEMKAPETVPDSVKRKLSRTGLWDVDSINLSRINWKNQPLERGGLFGSVNHMVIPPELTGVPARIIGLVGKWFPTGAHKVGATYGCLVPRLVTGQFDPEHTKAVWPSTGNFCRGGAYVSALLGCQSIAILPENMSRERFEWLAAIAGEVIATPGCESNVKEIFDKCWELRHSRNDIQIFNQFEELGNCLWHYEVTGNAFKQVLEGAMAPGDRLAGTILSSGSGGTLGAGYYLKEQFPGAKLAVAEALQCPTLLMNGFGDHRIEGIGDKHVPWIHDVRNTDMVVAVDDEITIRLLRLFNEPAGRKQLEESGVPTDTTDHLDQLGISGIGNLVAAIKFAKYYELDERDVVVTVFTDSMQLYGSRLDELNSERGHYQDRNAFMDLELLNQISIDNTLELSYYQKKRIHNLKYFTWVEQQQRDLAELNRQWKDPSYWQEALGQAETLDHYIADFNARINQ